MFIAFQKEIKSAETMILIYSPIIPCS